MLCCVTTYETSTKRITQKNHRRASVNNL